LILKYSLKCFGHFLYAEDGQIMPWNIEVQRSMCIFFSIGLVAPLYPHITLSKWPVIPLPL